jgi:DUF1009 family protein
VGQIAGSAECIGLVAGSGQLPADIARVICDGGGQVFVVAITPQTHPDIAQYPHATISLGQVGRMLALLRANNCRRIVICGGLTRPDLKTLRLDLGFFRHLPSILALMQGGDDHILRRVIRFFERQGFDIVGMRDVAPELLAHEGHLTRTVLGDALRTDVATGLRILQAVGQLDIGQAIAVADGRVLALEAAEGTDGMLRRLATQREQGDGRPAGGVLVKATKPGQELRIDLPTIGPVTVRNCRAAGLAGIAVEAGRSVIVDASDTQAAADEAGLAIVAMPPSTAAAGQVETESELHCLTRRQPGRQAIDDARTGSHAIRRLAQELCGHDLAMVVTRRYTLAVGIDEAADAVVRRAADLRQWGDRRSSRRRGVLVLSQSEQLTGAVVQAAVTHNLAGIVIASHLAVEVAPPVLQGVEREGLFLARTD